MSHAVLDRLTRSLGAVTVLATVAFMTVPVVVVIVLSFSGTSFIAFPPQEWGLRQYRTLAASDSWLAAVRMSLQIGLLSSLLSLAIGLLAVFGLSRARVRWATAIRFLGLSGLIIPISAYAVALYGTFAQLGILGTKHGLVISHSLLSIPLVLITVGAAIERIPRDLELAAMSLGASRRRAWVGVTLRLLSPAVIAAFLLGLVVSFDEAVFVSFLGGPDLVTLPKAVFDSVRFGTDAVITAISTILVVVTATIVAAAMWLSQAATSSGPSAETGRAE